MSIAPFVYLLLNLGSISFPLVRSFEPRVHYVGYWRHLFPAMLLTGSFFIAMDIWFTAKGIWAFNPEFLVGITIVNLPIEEWMFFIAIPFASIFIYACVAYFYKENIWRNLSYPVGLSLAAFLLVVAIWNYDKMYTFWKLGLTGLAILIHLFMYKDRIFGRFLVSWLFIMIPFFLVNGVLTYLPVVTYNDAENLGIRYADITGIAFLNIPIEDTFYGFLLMIMNVTIMEYLKERSK
jgi:lycopene cyclase domain-containing protein